jgi:hypothetical protein
MYHPPYVLGAHGERGRDHFRLQLIAASSDHTSLEGITRHELVPDRVQDFDGDHFFCFDMDGLVDNPSDPAAKIVTQLIRWVSIYTDGLPVVFRHCVPFHFDLRHVFNTRDLAIAREREERIP